MYLSVRYVERMNRCRCVVYLRRNSYVVHLSVSYVEQMQVRRVSEEEQVRRVSEGTPNTTGTSLGVCGEDEQTRTNCS